VSGPVRPAPYARHRQHGRVSNVRAVSFYYFFVAKSVIKISKKKSNFLFFNQKFQILAKMDKKIGAPTV
jgi:hypothetical protein